MSVKLNQTESEAVQAVESGATACRPLWPTSDYLLPENGAVYKQTEANLGPYAPTEADLQATDFIVDDGGDRPPRRS